MDLDRVDLNQCSATDPLFGETHKCDSITTEVRLGLIYLFWDLKKMFFLFFSVFPTFDLHWVSGMCDCTTYSACVRE